MLVTRGPFVGDTENLPKWAQRYISQLQAEIESLEGRLFSQTDEGDANTFLDPYRSSQENGQPIGKSPTIRFLLGENRRIDIKVEPDEEQLNVHVYDGSLLVVPWSTNVAKLRVETRLEDWDRRHPEDAS
jgi:hypothetical protein